MTSRPSQNPQTAFLAFFAQPLAPAGSARLGAKIMAIADALEECRRLWRACVRPAEAVHQAPSHLRADTWMYSTTTTTDVSSKAHLNTANQPTAPAATTTGTAYVAHRVSVLVNPIRIRICTYSFTSSVSLTRGKGTFGTGYPKKAHNGSHPLPKVYTSSWSAGTVDLTASLCFLYTSLLFSSSSFLLRPPT